ncbi:hypothetical protein GH714_007906 [Hevea brasiliensis]|uniref:B-like cyclin n=1 Tax=Hevea brasiliensis TaxID=3981 RepID=A0A6A6N931_HEVBR|nr:hypothetical protein GH714_007906 [Hevea brasiliensis]
MAQNPGLAFSSLLCAENSNTCFDDLDCNATDEFGISLSLHHQDNQSHNQDLFSDNDSCKSLLGFTIHSEDRVKEMVKREIEHLPSDDYLKRLRSGDLDLSVRREALDWIWKAQAHYNFGPLSVCLSMNYLDRFLSFYQLPKGKAWTVQLLAVACVSLAVKMEEANVPLSVDLQVGEPKFVFEAKTIQRMELLVLSTPSQIAAAVAISVSGEIQAGDIDKAVPCFIQVEKGRVFKCIELIKDLSLISGSAVDNVASASASCVPQSPNGVLDAACLSYKSDDLTVGSCANTSHNSPDIKRRKQSNKPSQMEHKS